MKTICILTILRVLESRWIKDTYSTFETGDVLVIENVNEERKTALFDDILPNTSSLCRGVWFPKQKRVAIFFDGKE